MTSDKNEEQKKAWQKMKKKLYNRLLEGDNQKYPHGGQSLIIKTERISADDKALKEKMDLAKLRASVKKVSQILEVQQRDIGLSDKETAFKKLVSELGDDWLRIESIFDALAEGTQPEIVDELEEWLVYLNEVLTPHADILEKILKDVEKDKSEHHFMTCLAASFLIAVAEAPEEIGSGTEELAVIRYSRSERQFVVFLVNEFSDLQEKKDLLVTFLLGKNPDFIIAQKLAKKRAFQESIKIPNNPEE